MPKVVKSKNNFYVHIPQEIVDSLSIKEGEELDVLQEGQHQLSRLKEWSRCSLRSK